MNFDVAAAIAEGDRLVHGVLVQNLEIGEEALQFSPERGFLAADLECGSKERTAYLLDLVDQDGKHHEIGKTRGQVSVAVTEIMA